MSLVDMWIMYMLHFSTADLNHVDDVMEMLAPTVSVDYTIEPIPEPDSQSEAEAPTTDATENPGVIRPLILVSLHEVGEGNCDKFMINA